MLRLRHAVTGVHEPLKRHPLGGWRCACGAPIADLEEAGYPGGGFVPVLRRVFTRGKAGGTTRTSAWGPSENGRGW